ncbi:MAG: NAD(P)-dependent oxidoreductase, partial [Verrucomicrobia bacterium]|nr:NAD(P)-dependent oxidoreductase [Verrucomicrobiota bacterium]
MPEKIGFVGVGRMGANMARRLKDQGYSVTAVFDSHA